MRAITTCASKKHGLHRPPALGTARLHCIITCLLPHLYISNALAMLHAPPVPQLLPSRSHALGGEPGGCVMAP